MAENESLDLKSPHAQRWNAVRDAARKGASCQKVGSVTRTKLYEAIRKVRKQFKEYGVSTADFLTARGKPRTLRDLLRKTGGHEFAELLISVLGSNPDATDRDCLKHWLRGVLDKMFSQIGHEVAGSDRFPSLFDTLMFFEEVQDSLEGDIELVATKLAADPECQLRQRTRKGEPKSDPTTDLLPMSLMGGPK